MPLPALPPIETILAIVIVIFFAIGLHEYAHCKFADMAGDPTPRIYGRVTLNLTKHFEPMGTLMIILTSLSGVGIGWGRPAPMNSSKMRNPKWDLFAAVAAGPVSNLVQAVLFAIAFRIALRSGGLHLNADGGMGFLSALLTEGILINLSLFLFNLVPLGPLDGHWLVGVLLPPRPQAAWYVWQRRYGGQALILLVLLGQLSGINPLGRIMEPLLSKLLRLLIGI